MRKAFVISLLAGLALAACQVNEIVEEIPESKSFTATIEDRFSGGNTRTSLDDNGNVLFKMGDQISIFAGSTVNEQYQVTDASDGKTSASFDKVSGSVIVFGGKIDNNVALYPYAESAEIDKRGSAYVISYLSLPEIQSYAEGSFGNGAFPMVAVTNDTEDMLLKFKNVLGGLKLQLKGTATIASITITGNNDEILCGDAEVTAAADRTPSINLTDASAKTVTLDCGEGVALDPETASPFIIALPPVTMESGFTVVLTDTEGKQMEIKTTKSQTINRSMLLKMPAVDYVGTISPSIPVPKMIDLGLSVKWASFNIGASAPEEFRDYFAWGEVDPKEEYWWNTYKWGNRTSFTKYNTKSSNGIVDNNTELLEEDDIAHLSLGGAWRIPTYEEWTELRAFCTWIWTNDYKGTGTAGMIVTSNKDGYTDKSIFLPATGRMQNSSLLYAGEDGNYWSSSLDMSDPVYAWGVGFDSGEKLEYELGRRCLGLSVRPVVPNYSFVLTDVSLDKTALTLYEGQEMYLHATNKSVTWRSSNPSVATVDSQGKVFALGQGHTTITVTTLHGRYTASCDVEVEQLAVDLGLSVKWASYNLGASMPEKYGNNYYAWGELNYKDNYDWDTYAWCAGSSTTLTKYNTKESLGTVDDNTKLDPEDDAVHVKWGGNWRIPTDEEWTELRDNCTWTWTSDYRGTGVAGMIVTSNKDGYSDKSIFLQASGYWNETGRHNAGSIGCYWSSSLMQESPYNAFSLYFLRSGSVRVDYYRYRYHGLPIRPVCD